MKTILFSALLGASMLLSGCQSFQAAAKYPASNSADLKRNVGYWRSTHLKRYDDATTSTEKRAIKREIVEGRIAAIDHFYRAYINKMYVEGKWVDFGSDTSIKVLGAFVALGDKVFSAKEIQVFGAGSALIAGMRDGYKKEVLFEKTLPVLIQTMNDARAQVLVELRAKEDSDETPLSECLNLVEKYYAAGGIITAINMVTKQGVNPETINANLSLDLETLQKVKARSQAAR